MMAAAWHRVGQFLRHSAARVTKAEMVRANEILGPLFLLFESLPVNEQRHGLDVLATLERLGGQDPVIRQAALLHDLGKAGASISIIDRSLAVFLNALSPGMLGLMLKLRPGFRRRYGLYRDHAILGAARLRSAGAIELAAVVAEHHDPHPRLEATRRLRRADGMN